MRSTRVFLRKDVIKKRRKRVLLRAFWLGFLSLVIMTSAIFALHQGPLKIVFYSIDGVVEGNEKVIRQIVDEYIHNGGDHLIPLDTIVTFPTGHIQKILSEDHLFSEVKIRRKFSFPFEILIAVEEKKIAHIVCIEEARTDMEMICDWYGLDNDGYVIKKIPNPTFSPKKTTSVSTTTLKVSSSTYSVGTSSVATATPQSALQPNDTAPLPTVAPSTSYIRVEKNLLGMSPQESFLGKQLVYPGVIQTMIAYSNMLLKNNYHITRYQVFDIKTHIYIKDNGYVIIPVGLSTKSELDIDKAIIDERVVYLESVLTDSSLSKTLYSSSTTSTVNKNAKASTTKSTQLLYFEYIDARLAKKIFIDPKNKDTVSKSTSTSTTTKPN